MFTNSRTIFSRLFALSCATCLIAFQSQTTAFASFDQDLQHATRNLLQDDGRVTFGGRDMDENGGFWKHLHKHFERPERAEREQGPLGCLLEKCGEPVRDCIGSKDCREFLRCQTRCGREGRRAEDVEGLEFNPTKCAFACIKASNESEKRIKKDDDAVKKFSMCLITSRCPMPMM